MNYKSQQVVGHSHSSIRTVQVETDSGEVVEYNTKDTVEKKAILKTKMARAKFYQVGGQKGSLRSNKGNCEGKR